MNQKELVVIDVKPGAAMESQSGIAQLWPRIYGAMVRAPGSRTAAIVMHPASNFMGHYLIEPLAAAGITTLGLNSRYLNNDSQLQMERVIQDLGAGVTWLRGQGYDKIVLIGNSGGAALAAFYQAQAEKLTATHTATGDPTGLSPSDLPPIDASPRRGRCRLSFVSPGRGGCCRAGVGCVLVGTPRLAAGFAGERPDAPSVVGEHGARAATGRAVERAAHRVGGGGVDEGEEEAVVTDEPVAEGLAVEGGEQPDERVGGGDQGSVSVLAVGVVAGEDSGGAPPTLRVRRRCR